MEITEKENKKQETTSSDWRLFGFKLAKSSISGEISPVTEGIIGELLAASMGVESELRSHPSNFNKSDSPPISSEPKKSSLRWPLETQCRHLRSCTKVVRTSFDILFHP